MREELRGVPVVVQDVDEQEVDEAEEQGVEDQPQLTEGRVEVLRAQVRARELDGELAPAPQLLDVRHERRQPHAVRLVHVAPRIELLLTRGIYGRTHSFT